MMRLLFVSLCLVLSNVSLAQLISPKTVSPLDVPKIGREWLTKQKDVSADQVTSVESQISKVSMDQVGVLSVLNFYFDVGNKEWLKIRNELSTNPSNFAPAIEFLKKSSDEFFKSNASLYLGRELAKSRRYEEALQVLALCKDIVVIDPAALYFYKAISAKETRQKDLANQNLKHLFNKNFEVADRYLDIAYAMHDEMESWEERDVGDLSRRMREVEADLSNAKGGAKTQEKQKEIISILDELIAKAEDKMDGNEGDSSQKGNESEEQRQARRQARLEKQKQSKQEMEDSKIIDGATGPGNVKDKNLITSNDPWGKLPEKEKIKALESLNRQLPPHIREAAEGFSKKLQQPPK